MTFGPLEPEQTGILMDLIVDLIDQLIEERIRIALADDNWDAKNDIRAILLKRKLFDVLSENISTGSESFEQFQSRVVSAVKSAQRSRRFS